MAMAATTDRQTRSRDTSRNNSRTSSPLTIQSAKNDDVWECDMCKIKFSDPNDKVLECQRCKLHFCIKCLNKSEREYKWMSSSDSMWFCVPCREKVERNIVVDREIEDKCREMAEGFEKRIKSMEIEMKNKCTPDDVKNIVKEELSKNNIEAATVNNEKDSVSNVISELHERKMREKNLIVYGLEEKETQNKAERQQNEVETIEKIAEVCEAEFDKEDVVKIDRIGIHDRTKKNKRPMIVTFRDPKKKVGFFKGGNNLRGSKEFEGVRLANDLTPTERENEKKLVNEAKELEKNCVGFRYKVRGPPWARKLVKEKM